MYVSTAYLDQQPSPPAKRGKWKAVILVVVFFLILLIILFIQSPFSKVRAIEIVGSSDLKPERILADSGLSKGMSVWKVRPSVVSAAILEKNPIVNKVDVSLNLWSGKVVIALSEKKVVGLFLNKGKFYRLLSDGTVYDESATDIPDIPILTTEKGLTITPGQKIGSPDFLMIANQLANADDTILKQISEVHQTNGQSWYSWVIYTKDKYEIRSDGKNLQSVLENYVKFRQQLNESGKPPGIINFWEGKAWYDAYSQSEDHQASGS
jgi:cell division protein FtsQ